jgi:hypothetical protein
VDCKGKSGGLMLLWNSNYSVEIQNYSRRHINDVVHSHSDDPSWKLTGFYGHPEAAKRGESWSLLRQLSTLSPSPWICMGDFNEITTAAEKSNHKIRPSSQMKAFQKALSDSRLGDLGFVGPKFTWCNGRGGRDLTKERLDRAVANSEWCSIFNVVEVAVLAYSCSDHNPLLVSFSHANDVVWQKNKIFRYESAWSKHPDQKEIIKKVWRPKKDNENSWINIQGNLKGCRKSLKKWVWRQKIPVELQIEAKTKELLSV